jgi:hypothetical protein
MHEPIIIRVTFLVAAVTGLAFGLFFLLAAEPAITSFELGAPTIPAALFARSTGALIVSLGIANFFAAYDLGSRAQFGLVIGNLVVHVLSIFADFSENYPRNAGVWIGLAVHVILIGAFGYCLVHWRQITRRA